MLYSSIREIPEWRFQKMQMLLLQQEGYGCTLADIDKRFERGDAFLAAGKIDEAIEERYNQRLAFHAMISGISFKTLALACMVDSIDGNSVDAETDDGLKAAHDVLVKLPSGEINDLIDELKKKLLAR